MNVVETDVGIDLHKHILGFAPYPRGLWDLPEFIEVSHWMNPETIRVLPMTTNAYRYMYIISHIVREQPWFVWRAYISQPGLSISDIVVRGRMTLSRDRFNMGISDF